MPKCTVCRQLFHPDWVVVVDTTKEGSDICKCVFCKTMKDEVTLTDAEGKSTGKVSKKEATINYLKYLRELSDDEGISKLLVKQGNKI